ncbi:hypothetical protein OG612_42800 (plasmid) [Streptomyces sp. NBC_01527]|uniref:hypothetical protein n=1 Tax=unclassified Streptomyces TaxID=2593676 RepID=UPI002E10E9B9|nr:hypothetical protein OG763_45410 [Streptomyces sp. NBC_01230]
MKPTTQAAHAGFAGTVLGGWWVQAVRCGLREPISGAVDLGRSQVPQSGVQRLQTALLVRRDAISALMDGMRSGDLDLESAKTKLQQAQQMRVDGMQTLGAVVVEGPAGRLPQPKGRLSTSTFRCPDSPMDQ